MLEPRNSQGEVPHLTMYQLANNMQAPLPIELIYLERIRLFTHILLVFDRYLISALVLNDRVAGKESWMHGARKSF